MIGNLRIDLFVVWLSVCEKMNVGEASQSYGKCGLQCGVCGK